MDPGSAAHRHSASKTRVNALTALRSIRGTETGKFCRSGISCPGLWTVRDSKNPGFIGFSTMARPLLINRRGKYKPRRAAFVGVLSMLLALGALSSAVDALKSLTSSKPSSQSTGFTNPFDSSGSASTSASPAPASTPGGGQISPATMSALLDAQGASTTGSTSASPSDALKDLFSQIDANGDGQLSKSEFENALGAGGTNIAQADDVFSKLDKDGSGTVSLDEMSSALKGPGGAGGARHHHHHVASTGDSSASSGSSGADADPLMQALAGTSSTSTTNSDGSTTTSLTYADGSKVTMTSPAAKTASGAATSSYNLIEQMIQRESQAISFSATNPSVSLSA
jgi:EF-hand domain pair